jgi:glucose/arabinose dehydrogenase
MRWLIIIVIILGGILLYRQWPGANLSGENRPTSLNLNSPDEVTIVQDLEVPWEMVWLPDGKILVTERDGRLLLIEVNGESQNKQVISIEGVRQTGESGLLGLALHPDFAANRRLYLYLTYASGGELKNRVEAYVLNGNSLSEKEVIVDGILGASNHDGGRIAFGFDGKLYITTGDAQQPELAQDKNSLNGKILRVNDDGSNLEVYSYGHRNIQGLAWDSQDRLWATEHGPSGTDSGWDEVNLIRQGGNYGWPEIQGDEIREGMISPVIQSGGAETWAPTGMVIVDNRLLFTGLRGETLYSATIDGDKLTNFERLFAKKWGRLRSVSVGPDGAVYVLTNNRDGRGRPKTGDDKIIKIKL